MMQSVFKVTRWGIGGLIALAALVGFLSQDIIPSLFLSGLAFLISPLSSDLVFSKLSKPVPLGLKIVAGFILLSGFAATLPPADTTQSNEPAAASQPEASTSPVPQVQGTETTATASSDPVDTLAFYPVTSVSDGDTIKVNVNGVNETVRLVGIDTPESVDRSKPVECLSLEASARMKELVTGKKVALEPDEMQSDRDQYKRLLRFVFLEDGTDVGLMMIKEGYAQESLYSSSPHKYHQLYVDAEEKARTSKVGLWADGVCDATTPAPATQPKVQTTPSSETGTAPIKTSEPAPKPAAIPPADGSFVCDCSKTCANLSCEEAQYQLNICGCKVRDGDGDGIACDSKCGG